MSIRLDAILDSLSRSEPIVPEVADRLLFAAAAEALSRVTWSEIPEVVVVGGFNKDPVPAMIYDMEHDLHEVRQTIGGMEDNLQFIRDHFLSRSADASAEP